MYSNSTGRNSSKTLKEINKIPPRERFVLNFSL